MLTRNCAFNSNRTPVPHYIFETMVAAPTRINVIKPCDNMFGALLFLAH